MIAPTSIFRVRPRAVGPRTAGRDPESERDHGDGGLRRRLRDPQRPRAGSAQLEQLLGADAAAVIEPGHELLAACRKRPLAHEHAVGAQAVLLKTRLGHRGDQLIDAQARLRERGELGRARTDRRGAVTHVGAVADAPAQGAEAPQVLGRDRAAGRVVDRKRRDPGGRERAAQHRV